MRPSDDAYAPDPIGSQPVDPPVPGSPDVPRPRATAWWQGATVALISGAILFGACQGDNLWSGNSETMQPKIVGIAAPAQVYPGDTIQVQISAYATRQVQRVELSISGAASVDTAVTLGAPAVSVAQTFRIALPTFLADTTLIIKAVVYDKVGAASRQRSDTAKAVAPPMIIDFAGPDSVRPGTAMRIAVRAVGVRPVTRIRVQLRGAVQKFDSINVLQPRKDVSDTISFPISVQEVVDTTVIVDMQAVDNAGLGGYVARTTIPVAIPAPSVISVAKPTSVIAGKPLDLTVQARGLRNISTINYSFRGALTSDVSMPVTPASRSVTQSKSFTIPANATSSAVRFTITATDVAGNVSTAWTDSVPVPTGAPVVDNLIVPDSLRPGTPLDARVSAHGTRNIVSVDLRLRGATTADVTKQPLQADTAVTVDFSVPVPEVIADSLLVVSAKATDASGAVSPWVDRTLKLSDTAPPTVTMSLAATNFAAGRPVPVHIIAKDNVGLSWVGARILSSTSAVIAGDSILTSGRSRDTTFNITLPLSGPRSLTVVGFARDRGNREGKATASITVVDSTAPVVNITSPADNATLPIGDPLSVTVSVTDLLGIKSIALSGVALRTSNTADPVVVARYLPVTVTYPQPPSLQLPQNPTVTRVLQPTADTTGEQVRIIAVVVDSAGNTGVDTVYTNLGGPRVEIRSPVNGGPPATVGMPLSVRMFAIDRVAKIDSLRLDVSGALTQTLRFPKGRMPNTADSVLIDTIVTPTSTGTLTLNLSAWNGRGIIGRAITPVTIQVVPVGTGDVYAPFVKVTSLRYRNADLVDQNTRVELTDTISVHVQATDNGSAGVKRMGITVLAIPNGTVPGIVPETLLVKFATARTGTQDTTFYIVPRLFGFNERVAALGPKLSVQLQFHAFAVDGQGNCGSTTQLGVNDSIACAYAYSNPAADTFYTASRGTPLSRTIQLVGGRTVFLPGGGNIADAVVDSLHKQLYLSNIAANKIDVLKLTDTTFIATGTATGLGLVGSQPWGMSLNNGKDTLIVANSGSTNVSFVVVNGGANNLKEDVSRRLMTPNEVLFEIETALTAGLVRYKVTFFDFSDRPQFVAQDMMGRLVYSTTPTGSAPDGTLRYVLPRPPLPGTTLEPKLLFNGKAIDPTADRACIAYIDSVQVYNGGASNDRVILYDHVPGSPGALVSNSVAAGGPGPVDLASAVAWLQTHGSDIFIRTGKWKVDQVGMSDTTFMAVSADRGKVAFGEGGVAPAGRIMVWDGTKPLNSEAVSNDVAVQDLVNNASERVFGLGLNANGSLGVARGAAGAYFFTPDLRLQGLFLTPGGAGGAAMHPANTAPSDELHGLAFISTPNSSIKILDSVHFFQKGEITLRDNVVGPVKAALPLDTENTGLVAGQCNFILVKLYAVTGYTDGAGNHTQVNIANVREKDINPTCTP